MEATGARVGSYSLERPVLGRSVRTFVCESARLHAEGHVADANALVALLEVEYLVQDVVVQEQQRLAARNLVVHVVDHVLPVGGRHRRLVRALVDQRSSTASLCTATE